MFIIQTMGLERKLKAYKVLLPLPHLFYQIGEQSLNIETFLSLKEEVFKEHRESLLMLLNDFIISTKRFLHQ